MGHPFINENLLPDNIIRCGRTWQNTAWISGSMALDNTLTLKFERMEINSLSPRPYWGLYLSGEVSHYL